MPPPEAGPKVVNANRLPKIFYSIHWQTDAWILNLQWQLSFCHCFCHFLFATFWLWNSVIKPLSHCMNVANWNRNFTLCHFVLSHSAKWLMALMLLPALWFSHWTFCQHRRNSEAFFQLKQPITIFNWRRSLCSDMELNFMDHGSTQTHQVRTWLQMLEDRLFSALKGVLTRSPDQHHDVCFCREGEIWWQISKILLPKNPPPPKSLQLPANPNP